MSVEPVPRAFGGLKAVFATFMCEPAPECLRQTQGRLGGLWEARWGARDFLPGPFVTKWLPVKAAGPKTCPPAARYACAIIAGLSLPACVSKPDGRSNRWALETVLELLHPRKLVRRNDHRASG